MALFRSERFKLLKNHEGKREKGKDGESQRQMVVNDHRVLVVKMTPKPSLKNSHPEMFYLEEASISLSELGHMREGKVLHIF